MMSITGKAGTLMLDSAVGHEVFGSEAAPFSLEARSGVRAQRNAVHGEVGAVDFTLQTPELVDGGADVLLGARAAMRPTPWLTVTGGFDFGVLGGSDNTWSTTIDSSLRVADSLSVTAGWRSQTVRGATVNTLMRGPRVALQFLF